MAANRDGDARLALGREIREIAVALRRPSKLAFDVHVLWAATARDFRQAFLDVNPDILHFCGHGTTAGPILEHTQPGNEALDGEALCNWLRVALEGRRRPLEVAVLNFCDSRQMLDTLADMATLVIGPTRSILDEDAIMFSTTFYMALAAGGNGSFSYHLGENAVEMTRSPVVARPGVEMEPSVISAAYGIRCQRAIDLVLVDAVRTRRQRRRTIAFFASEPEVPDRLRLDRELRSILDVLSPRAFRVEQRWATRVVDFLQTLMEARPAVVHLTGHGMIDGAFLFEHDRHPDGAIALSHTLTRVFTAFRLHIECAVLLFGYSGRIARDLDDTLDYVIGVDGALEDSIRQQFSEAFYQMVSAGRSYRNAFDAAIAAVPGAANGQTTFTIRGRLANTTGK